MTTSTSLDVVGLEQVVQLQVERLDRVVRRGRESPTCQSTASTIRRRQVAVVEQRGVRREALLPHQLLVGELACAAPAGRRCWVCRFGGIEPVAGSAPSRLLVRSRVRSEQASVHRTHLYRFRAPAVAVRCWGVNRRPPGRAGSVPRPARRRRDVPAGNARSPRPCAGTALPPRQRMPPSSARCWSRPPRGRPRRAARRCTAASRRHRSPGTVGQPRWPTRSRCCARRLASRSPASSSAGRRTGGRPTSPGSPLHARGAARRRAGRRPSPRSPPTRRCRRARRSSAPAARRWALPDEDDLAYFILAAFNARRAVQAHRRPASRVRGTDDGELRASRLPQRDAGGALRRSTASRGRRARRGPRRARPGVARPEVARWSPRRRGASVRSSSRPSAAAASTSRRRPAELGLLIRSLT